MEPDAAVHHLTANVPRLSHHTLFVTTQNCYAYYVNPRLPTIWLTTSNEKRSWIVGGTTQISNYFRTY